MSEMGVPIKFKRRLFYQYRSLWDQALLDSIPESDFGRGKTSSSLIPNLSRTEIESFLKGKYGRKFVVFTNCASDALDFTVKHLPFETWYVPSYTWLSPVSAIAKAGKKIVFLDVHPEKRTLLYEGYDDRFPVLVPHVDGYAAPRPPGNPPFVLEDAAQSPLSSEVNFGDAIILSFGSSKRLGLLGQGGALLTDDQRLAEMVHKETVFGLDDKRDLIFPGSKSFFDPFNARCTLELFRIYEKKPVIEKLEQIKAYYEDMSGVAKPSDLERFTIQCKNREKMREVFSEKGIETRVWFKKHCSLWPTFEHFNSRLLKNTDSVAEQSFDIPFNELLTDGEVERVGSCLKENKENFLYSRL